MISTDELEMILESIVRTMAIIILLWPFVGIITITLIYQLFRIAITREGIEVSKPRSDQEFLSILVCIAGAVLGWLAFLLAPIAVFIWFVTQFIFLVSGATKVYTQDHQ